MAADILGLASAKSYMLVDSISHAIERIGTCSECGAFAEEELCPICADDERETNRICVVQNALDVWQMDATGQYKGKYIVLGGVLSPIDQIGPDDLRIAELQDRVINGAIDEIIFALPATAEAEATIHFIRSTIVTQDVLWTHLAYGIPVGGSLEYLDTRTIEFALTHRRPIE